MDAGSQFIFRKQLSFGNSFAVGAEYPCLLYVFQKVEVVTEPGDKLCLKTQLKILLSKKFDPAILVDLRKIIFTIAKYTGPFLKAKQNGCPSRSISNVIQSTIHSKHLL